MAIRRIAREPKSADGINLVHLTDLHFGPSLIAGRRPAFLQAAELELTRRLREGGVRPDLLLVTGDLVHQGDLKVRSHRQVMREAVEYLRYLCGVLEIDPADGLVVVPGNHDCKWSGLFAYPLVGRRHFDDLAGPYTGHRLYTKMGLLLGCFDSNVVRGPLELAMGSVDIQELARLEAELAGLPADQQPTRRVALVHHHPLPVPPAERLSPGGLLERTIGRAVVGAPELMVMRNAGTFLQRLLRDGFRLVLHGHLHEPCYWGPVRGYDGQEQWLEVISGPSFGAPPDGYYAFGLVRLLPGGGVEYTHGGVNAEGRARDPVRMATASFETVRSDRWLHNPAAPRPQVRCRLHHKIWEVVLPEGDLWATETYHGLTCTGDVPQDTVKLFSGSHSLTRQRIRAASLTGEYHVTVDHEVLPREPGQRQVIEYRLRFKPPLKPGYPADVVCQRHSMGAMFSTTESQRLWGTPAAEFGSDGVSQTVWFPTERLMMDLYFSDESSAPRDVALGVFDEQDRPAPGEAGSAHVANAYWTGSRLPAGVRLDNVPPPQGFVSVFRPQLRHKYRMSWDLGDVEPIPARASLQNVRARLLDLPYNEPRRRKAVSFLTSCVAKARDLIALAEPNAGDDRTLHACLFALDEASTMNPDHTPSGRPALLRSVATTAGNCALCLRDIPWGRDIVGRAMRTGTAIFLDRLRRDGIELIENLPTEVMFLLACPLYFLNVDGLPVRGRGDRVDPEGEWSSSHHPWRRARRPGPRRRPGQHAGRGPRTGHTNGMGRPCRRHPVPQGWREISGSLTPGLTIMEDNTMSRLTGLNVGEPTQVESSRSANKGRSEVSPGVYQYSLSTVAEWFRAAQETTASSPTSAAEPPNAGPVSAPGAATPESQHP